MHRLLITFSLFCLVIIFAFTHFVVALDHPEFVYKGFQATKSGKAFTGLAYHFHQNNQLHRLMFFWNGKQTATEHRWYSNGQKWFEIEFENGLRHGQTRIWYANGNVQYLKNYSYEKPHGEFWGWHDNGTVSNFHKFDQGQQLIYKAFISDGKPFHNYIVKDLKRIGLDGGKFCRTK